MLIAISMVKPTIETDEETTTFRYDLAVAHRFSAEAYFNKGERDKAIETLI